MSDLESSSRVTEGHADLQIPPIPRALPKVLAPLHESGFAGQEAVFAAIDCQPSLEERILNHINARLRRSTSNLERAVQMIGSTTAAGLIIGLSLQRWNALRDGPAGSCLLRLIYHSEATAVLTQKLLRKGSDENSGSARDHPETSLEWPGFAKGLFHDLGKLVLIYNYPEKAGALYSLERTSRRPEKIDPQVVEHGVFGCGHTEVGAQAVASLDLPGPLAAVAEHHHDDESMAEDQDLRAVRAANLLTKTMNSELAGLSASRATLDWNTCVNDPVWSDWLDDASEPALKTLKEDFMRETILYTRFFLDLPDVETFSD